MVSWHFLQSVLLKLSTYCVTPGPQGGVVDFGRVVVVIVVGVDGRELVRVLVFEYKDVNLVGQ